MSSAPMALVVDRLRHILPKTTDLHDYLDQYDVLMNGTIEKLVREHRISAEKAITTQFARDL